MEIRPARPSTPRDRARLLAHLKLQASARGCARFEWSVLDWNAEAKRPSASAA